jgi:hypothetical protein
LAEVQPSHDKGRKTPRDEIPDSDFDPDCVNQDMVRGIHDDITPDPDDESFGDADADSDNELDAIDGELGTVDETFPSALIQIPYIKTDVMRFWTSVSGLLQGRGQERERERR